MQQEQKNQKSKQSSFFFVEIGVVVIGMIFLLCSSLWAQPDQTASLEWVAGQRTDPMIVSSHEAVFQIMLIDSQEPDPNKAEVWIDADGDGQYGASEKIPLGVVAGSGSTVSERRYTTTVYFDTNKQIQFGKISNLEKLPESFETKFRFYFIIEDVLIIGVGDDPDPADENNQLLVLNKNCDADDDGIKDLEEGAGLLPKSYCPILIMPIGIKPWLLSGSREVN